VSTPAQKPPSIVQISTPRIIEVATSLQPNAHTAPPGPEAGAKAPTRRSLWKYGLVGCALAGAVNLGVSELKRAEVAPTVVSGKAGLKQTSSGRFQRWRKQRVEVRIDSSVDALGGGTRDAIRAAFSSWSSAGIALPEVRFRSSSGAKLSSTPDGVSTVLYAPIDIEGHTNDLAVTIAFSDPSSGEIVEADVVINSRHQFAALSDEQDKDDDDDGHSTSRTSTTNAAVRERDETGAAGRCVTHSDGMQCGRKYDIQNVMTHEAGHFFGLAEDVHEPSATMYECISACETRKRALSTEDASAVTELYAEGFEADTQPEAAGCSGAHIARTTHAGVGGLAASLLAVLGVAVLRRRRASRTDQTSQR
jgi:hypothetical protein